MFKLRQVTKILNETYIKQMWRRCATETKSSEPLATQHAWQEKQMPPRYKNEKFLLYSSYLDNQIEFMDYRRRKAYEFRLAKEEHKKWLRGKEKGKVVPPQAVDDELINSINANDEQFPQNWMDDYEFYEGSMDIDGNINSTQGTADSTVPLSKVPCSGCGAHLHCANVSLPGFIPKEIFKGRTDKELKTIVCKRCHFLKHYNIALDVEVTRESYVETISQIRNEFALAIVIVDLLDFPSSVWPDMQQLLGSKRPVFIVGNKVDLLPRDCNSYLDHITSCLHQQVLQIGGFNAMNIKHVGLVSAKTGYGIEELITQLHKNWLYKGDVYLIGCTNVGKSSLFNILLNSDYCRPEATDLIRKATTCPWPGTTLQMLKFPILRPSEIRVFQRFQRLFSERAQKAAAIKLRRDQAIKTGSIQAAQLIGTVGRTLENRESVSDVFSMSRGSQPIVSLNERSLEYQKAKWCYDTPGVLHPEQITPLLTTEELMLLQPDRMISPRALRLKPGMSVFLAGLGRLDFIEFCDPAQEHQYDWVKVLVFGSSQLPVVITKTVDAAQMYDEYLGTPVLGVPCGTAERLSRWPGLQCKSKDVLVVDTNSDCLSCDITLSSAGWLGIKVPPGSECRFKVWTPHACGIYIRTPALIPHAERLVGTRIRNSLAYNLSKPFVFRK